MCFSDGSLAPEAPGAGTAGAQQALTLTAADGNVLLAYETRSTKAQPTIGVIVLPDIRGLHAYYKDLTVRLAELGWDSIAIDYFGRTATDDDRSETFEFRPHIEATTPQGIAQDVQAALQHLRDLGCEAVFTLGFCFGGGYSWRQSADTVGLAGCIGFYGSSRAVLPVIEDMKAPLQLLVAGADAHIPVEDVRQISDKASVITDFIVFDDAPHSFFDRTAPEHVDACGDAWNHIVDFVETHS